MSKLIFFLFVFFIGPAAHAAGLTFRLDQVPATQLLAATYKNILGKSYAVDPLVLTNPPLVTFDVQDWPADKLASTVDAVLLRAGVEKSVTGDGLVYFALTKTAQRAASLSGLSFDGAQGFPGGLSGQMPGLLDGELKPTSDFAIYVPHDRTVSSLQAIANQLLGTKIDAGDVVVLVGDQERVERARFVLESLDQAVPEIQAKVLVVEFTSSEVEGNTFEFALSALGGKLNIGVTSLLSPGENVLKFTSGDFSSILSAVSGDSRFSVVSSPVLRVKDGKTGSVEVGQEVPTLSTTSFDNQGNAQQSIKYRSAGVIFEMKPSIMKNRIELELKQQISDFKANDTSGIDSPTLSKRELSTVVQARDGDLIVLGGLDQKKDSTSARGFSFLPSFMRSNSAEKSRTQVLIFLQVDRVS
ncbi:type II secretion system protein GspD [Pseudomonas putida]|uniref:type II secretion system protein GspD n=1 Tax=Pseudomonas putida TaxID=303 RepID=UPI00069D1CEF|nr:hypothetical protein [Pseudomonas putida]